MEIKASSFKLRANAPECRKAISYRMKRKPAAPAKPYKSLGLETMKFDYRREAYWRGIRTIVSMAYPAEDLIHHFPAFAGHVCLGRYLAFYETYKLAMGTAGHIAEAGVWKGSSLLWFSKLTQLFEPESLTQVHGFDWFRGNHPDKEERHLVDEGSYFESKARLTKLVQAQGLDNVVRLHELDLSSGLKRFFGHYSHLRFKLVFLDCGLYRVVRHCVEHFWPRITPGGLLVLDNFNHETAPGEAKAVAELLGEHAISTFPWAQQPTAYIRKPAAGT
jgi:hypothetical protein